ncbi:GntR family transcriptional regulator [Veillonella agrestimuris]|uniref:GntR family transcriptional regulator n=1 Tax=Veillonella agrestimuris TaxID=2941340 RepID=UPI00203CAA12|nr:GntR family transcriptional regulator [Veillonella agrestimuris]
MAKKPSESIHNHEKKEGYQLSVVDSIERLPLSEQVYLALKQAILTGELMPDEKLNEVKIAEQLRVSATPVREAFRKLAKDNLVVIVPWKGVRVKGDTPEEIIALYQCREVMEGLGARLCARHATPEQVAELKELCKEMHAIEDATERVDVNSRFHTMIAQFSGNERVLDYLSDFRERVNRDMYLSSFDAGRTHECDDEHDQIISAIERHDEVAAENAMRQHINNAFIFKRANAELAQKQNSEAK